MRRSRKHLQFLGVQARLLAHLCTFNLPCLLCSGTTMPKKQSLEPEIDSVQQQNVKPILGGIPEFTEHGKVQVELRQDNGGIRVKIEKLYYKWFNFSAAQRSWAGLQKGEVLVAGTANPLDRRPGSVLVQRQVGSVL